MKELLIVLLLALASAKGEDVGVDYLALQGFSNKQCSAALKAFSHVRGKHLGILWNTFGRETFCIERFLELKGAKSLRIHPTNETCRRAPRYCAIGEVNRGYHAHRYNKVIAKRRKRVLNSIRSRANWVKAFVDAHAAQADFILTYGLEDNFDAKAFNIVRGIYKDVFNDSVQFARSRAEHVYRLSAGADLVEYHGLHSINRKHRGQCIRSLDGTHASSLYRSTRPVKNRISDSELHSAIKAGRNNHCRIYLWTGEQQGIFGTARKFIEPRKRCFIVASEVVGVMNRILRSY